jgi:hypothetical protein
MESQHFRSIFDLKDDGTLPRGWEGYGDDARFKPRGRRMRAIEEVLRRLPEPQYAEWRARIEQVTWFIPSEEKWGQVDRFPAKQIVYLSPILELADISDAAIVGLTAHEIAHFLLNHVGAEMEWAQKEAEVNRAVRAWGFALEAEATDRELFSFFRHVKQDLEQDEAVTERHPAQS